MIKGKIKGTKLERDVADFLRGNHFKVIRSAGSFGSWDLVAFPHVGFYTGAKILVIQVGPHSRQEVKQSREEAENYHHTYFFNFIKDGKYFVITDGRKTYDDPLTFIASECRVVTFNQLQTWKDAIESERYRRRKERQERKKN